ncbi:MAG TPA: tetratricopeptide repeat protein [Urbifossiella sp.]|nr:tetratricopeptide repeat protein [Urbifossiella sp.]
MCEPTPTPADLFDEAWQEWYRTDRVGLTPSIADYLPAGQSEADRAETLITLIRIDQEYRWSPAGYDSVPGLGRPVRDYLAEWPAVSEPHRLISLVDKEVEVRRLPSGEQLRLFGELLKVNVARHPMAEPPAPPPGAPAVASYDILERLNDGGQATLWLAQPRGGGPRVVIKVPKEGLANLARHTQEVTALQTLHQLQPDETIIDLREFSLDPPYLVTTYYPEGSLDKRLCGTPLGPREAARLTARLAGPVGRAHDKGIIHRDVKPANTLLRRADGDNLPRLRPGDGGQYDVVLADLGCAHLPSEGGVAGPTLPGQAIGTPSYMPPEQARRDGCRAAATADVYSLGAVLYECLTGRPPFLATSPEGTIQQVIADEGPVPPSRLIPTVPRDLETICLKCLRKEPDGRYAKAQDLADDLGRFLNGEAILARPESLTERARRWCRRRPAITTAVGAAVLLLVIGGVAYKYLVYDPTRVRDVAESSRANDVRAVIREFDGRLALGDLGGAASKLQGAEGRVEGSESLALWDVVKEARKDYDAAAGLERVRSNLSALGLRGGVRTRGERMVAVGLDSGQADREFGAIFESLGMTIGQDHQRIIPAIRSSRIRKQLVQALDFWAVTHISVGGGRSKDLLMLAAAADADSVREKLRLAVSNGAPDHVKRVARGINLEEQTPSTLMVLSSALYKTGVIPEGRELLQQGVTRWPGDFWLNNELSIRFLIDPTADPRSLAQAVRYAQGAVACRPESAMAHSNLAFALAAVKDWAGSLDAADQALKLDGDNPAALLNRSRALMKLDRWPEARASCLRVLGARPDFAEALVNLGECDRTLGDLESAATAAQKALKAAPNLPAALVLRATVKGELSQWKEAEKDCRSALEHDGDLARAWSNLSLALGEQQKLTEALDAADRAVQLDPDDYVVLYNRATVRWWRVDRGLADHSKKDELGRIHRDLDAALALKPKFAAAFASRGIVFIEQGRLDKAREALREANDVDPDSPDGFLLEGMICRARKDAKGMANAMRKAADSRPMWALAHNNLAAALGLLHDYEGCIRSAQKALSIDPTLDTPHLSMAAALAALGRHNEAIREYEEYIRGAQNPSGFTYVVLAISLGEVGSFPEAVSAYEKALKLLPPFAPERSDIARRITAAKRRMEVRNQMPTFQKTGQWPQDAEDVIIVADLSRRLDRAYAFAVKAYQEAFRLDPELDHDLKNGNRYNAACCACLAASGNGTDAATLGDEIRADLRRRAAVWLRAELDVLQKQVRQGTETDKASARRILKHWTEDSDLESIRSATHLAKLPEATRTEWRTLWDEVAGLLNQDKNDR